MTHCLSSPLDYGRTVEVLVVFDRVAVFYYALGAAVVWRRAVEEILLAMVSRAENKEWEHILV